MSSVWILKRGRLKFGLTLYAKLYTKLNMKNLKRETAYLKLRDAITFGDLKPGEKLVEKAVCEMFDIGRTPLREALRQLQMEGYVDVSPNKGAVIRKLSIEELDNVYDVLALLEGYSAEMATKNITASQLTELKKISEETRKAAHASDHQSWFVKNDHFHFFLIDLAGNPILTEEIRKLRRRIYRYRALALTLQGNIEDLAQQHDAVVVSVVQGKSASASLAMRQHVEWTKGLLISFLQQNTWI